jgi:hypothetical protein
MKIVTIGVYGSTEPAFFNALQQAAVDTFCDIRWRRGVRGSEYAFVNSARLQKRLAELGIRYLHLRHLAPPPALRQRQLEVDESQGTAKRKRTALAQAFIDAYRAECLSHFQSAEFLTDVGPEAKIVALLCGTRSRRLSSIAPGRTTSAGSRPRNSASNTHVGEHVKVLIVAKTRRGGGACVGGLTEGGHSVRLIAADAATNERAGLEYEIGEVWEIDSYPDPGPLPPHVENIIVRHARRVRTSTRLIETIYRFMPPVFGGPEVLFEGLTHATPVGTLYVAESTGLPSRSTMFWLPDQPLQIDVDGKRLRYRYPTQDGGRTLTFVGFQ